MNTNWKQDPRLKGMNQQKLELLTTFAQEVESAPKEQLMSTILTLNLKANEKGIHFSDQETELLVSILSGGMSPAERKRMDTLRMISKNLSERK